MLHSFWTQSIQQDAWPWNPKENCRWVRSWCYGESSRKYAPGGSRWLCNSFWDWSENFQGWKCLECKRSHFVEFLLLDSFSISRSTRQRLFATTCSKVSERLLVLVPLLPSLPLTQVSLWTRLSNSMFTTSHHSGLILMTAWEVWVPQSGRKSFVPCLAEDFFTYDRSMLT